MKIIFICGCLEPGFDGVGDYTRRLASELTKQNVEVATLAINDQFISDPTNQNQTIENISIETYRLPSKYLVKQRFELASIWIDTINPTWLSLQFVPFSFNVKGLPFNLGKNLSKLTKGRNWHIMFHELWVGMDEKSSVKHKVWGEVQKILIQQLIKQLKPKLISTQTKLYQVQLKKLGFNADLLPLFSNIPFNKDKVLDKNKNNTISLVNFGTIHPGAPFKDFAFECAQYSKNNNIKIELTFLGRCGAEQETWIQIWKSVGLTAIVAGEQPVDKISEILYNATIGLSSTALPLIEKSGSVAAMHEHNLSVICISNSWNPRGIGKLPLIDGVIAYISGILLSCLNNKVEIKGNNVLKVSQTLKKSFELFEHL